ncbi:hypothetical protein Tco_1485618 [Tanacetum coccineum]
MDSSMGKMCLGKDVIEISSDRNEGFGDWDSPEYKDTTRNGGKKKPEALVFYIMVTEEDSDRYIAQCSVNGLYAPDGEISLEKNDNLIWNNYAVKLCLEYEVRKGKKLVKKELMVSLHGEIYLVQFIINPEEDELNQRALAHNIIMRYEMLEEVRLVIETLAYHDKYRKLLDKIWADKVRLDGMIKLEEGRAMIKVKGQMLKEQKDPGAFIFLIRLEGLINENALADTRSDINTMPYRIYEQLGRDDIIQEDRNITMINYTEAEVTVGCDSDDEEDYVIKRNDIGTPIHKFRPIRYQNNTNPAENMTLPTLESTSRAYDHEAGSSRTKRSRNVETVEEALLLNVHHEFFEWIGCSREAKSRYKTRLVSLLHKLTYSLQIVDWQLLHTISCGKETDQMLKISLREAQSNEEIFFSMAWVRAFNIREPIYPELCRELYTTYEFNEVCADDELQSKKIISFRLGGHSHSLTLLEFARRLGLYHAGELKKEGFDTYFQGGLRSDENFNAREYWERISIDRDLHLSRSSIISIRFPILRVLHKMITYGLCQRTTGYEKIQKNDLWLLSMFEDRHQNGYASVAWVIAKWMKRKEAGSQKESQICCGQFLSKSTRKSRVLTNEIERTLTTSIYCRDLDRTTLRELIDSEDRLIPDIPIDDVPRVSSQRAPRVQRASMQDLYERMGSMEIKQQANERVEYRKASLGRSLQCFVGGLLQPTWLCSATV